MFSRPDCSSWLWRRSFLCGGFAQFGVSLLPSYVTAVVVFFPTTFQLSQGSKMRFVPIIARTWLAQQTYGWRFAPCIDTVSAPFLYVKIIIFAVGAETLQTSERAHIRGLVEVMMEDPEPDLLNFVEHYTYTLRPGSTSPTFLTATSSSSLGSPTLARVLIYDAVSASCADDDYDSIERANVARVAHQFALPTDRVHQIERLVMREVEIRQRKSKLLRRRLPPPTTPSTNAPGS
jgi:hypothetical protein